MDDLKQINARIPVDLYRKVKIKLARTGKTMTAIIQEFLEKWVENEKTEGRGGRTDEIQGK